MLTLCGELDLQFGRGIWFAFYFSHFFCQVIQTKLPNTHRFILTLCLCLYSVSFSTLFTPPLTLSLSHSLPYIRIHFNTKHTNRKNIPCKNQAAQIVCLTLNAVMFICRIKVDNFVNTFRL